MDYIALALSLLQTALASAQAGKAEQEVIAVLQSAMQKLLQTEGSNVTFQQLESLRSKTTW
jgi:DNA-binding Xre family transcriptional regulator